MSLMSVKTFQEQKDVRVASQQVGSFLQANVHLTVPERKSWTCYRKRYKGERYHRYHHITNGAGTAEWPSDDRGAPSSPGTCCYYSVMLFDVGRRVMFFSHLLCSRCRGGRDLDIRVPTTEYRQFVLQGSELQVASTVGVLLPLSHVYVH